MRMIEIGQLSLVPGDLVTWRPARSTLDAAVGSPPHPARASYAQEAHLLQVAGSEIRSPRWTGVSFELTAPADLDRLGVAWEMLMRRHSALRTGFRVCDRAIERFLISPRQVRLDRVEVGGCATGAALAGLLEESTNPLVWPDHVFAAVVRGSDATVVMAADHLNTDLYSLAFVVHEIQELYAAAGERRRPMLQSAGDHIGFCHAQRAEPVSSRILRAGAGHWQALLDAGNGMLPSFPVDLGVAKGTRHALRGRTFDLFDETTAASFDERCQAEGSGFFQGLLAAAAHALRDLAGTGLYRTIVPLHTRSRPTEPSLGWYGNAAPVCFETGPDLTATLAAARAATLAAARTARLPVELVEPLVPGLGQVNGATWFSYVDFRIFPGADAHDEIRAHILNPAGRVGDDADFWVNRGCRNTTVFARYPDTHVADESVQRFISLLARNVIKWAADGRVPEFQGRGGIDGAQVPCDGEDDVRSLILIT